jgi:ATP-dependent DNA helicase RecG
LFDVNLNTEIDYLKGVGPQRAALLKKEIDVFVFEDLLNHFPFRYVDRSKTYKISEIFSDSAYVQLKGSITDVSLVGAKKAQRLVANFQDDTGEIELVWFRGIKWIKDTLIPGKDYIVFGKPSKFNKTFNIVHPEISTLEKIQKIKTGIQYQPIYSSTEKLTSKGLDTKGIEKLQRELVPKIIKHLEEILPQEVVKKLNLINRQEAYQQIHFPENPEMLEKAKLRLKFEELFFVQLEIYRHKWRRNLANKGFVFSIVGDYFNKFFNEILPFELTGAQKKVLKEIRVDLKTGRQMNRLLQGDVGSGKTIVAFMSMLIALDNGFQSCLMAPTEILANQHFQTISKFAEKLDIRVGLLTGSTKRSARNELHAFLESGELKILIGTHALIEDKVKFTKLGLVVVDEQHRFGVAQRAKLWKKSDIFPHVLVMTATPIPRTLAMTFYGDLDVSVIDELPPGRKEIKTIHYFENNRLKLFGSLKKVIREGRQVYIVYPLIEESEKLDYANLMEGFDVIAREFPRPEYQVGIVHGRMKAADKEQEMQRFKKGELHILVSTTVIEVGVDVPNASVMVIESSERFGLSQLHQLRGRVGRGEFQSYCILMSGNKLSNDAKTRLQTMVDTNDGFKIAEVDLKLRGPGDITGTQQSGLVNFKLADLATDHKILKTARIIAHQLIDDDPELSKPQNQGIKKFLRKKKIGGFSWSEIS